MNLEQAVQTITVLGATGSIGRNTLDVVNRHPDRFRVFAITGNSQVKLLMQQAKECNSRYVVLAKEEDYAEAKSIASDLNIDVEIVCGQEALESVSSAPEVDIVMAAIVGSAGLKPTLAAAKAGKKILLANKESLVMSGQLFIDIANENNATILPIDSEHNAIFQCLPQDYQYGNLSDSGISSLLLTGSGGPFRERDIASFGSISMSMNN